MVTIGCLSGGFMKKLNFWAIIVALSIALIPSSAGGQDFGAESEKEKTRLDKDEITKLMIQVGRMPVPEQNSRMDRLWKDPSGSETPRSDFLFCAGLAYLGNYKAQACLGGAYENGRGIVSDSYESYVWYTVALDNPIDDPEAVQNIKEARDRVKFGLISVYPAPSDQELDKLVTTQKDRISEYQAETGN
jgi:hypothetical protein